MGVWKRTCRKKRDSNGIERTLPDVLHVICWILCDHNTLSSTHIRECTVYPIQPSSMTHSSVDDITDAVSRLAFTSAQCETVMQMNRCEYESRWKMEMCWWMDVIFNTNDGRNNRQETEEEVKLLLRSFWKGYHPPWKEWFFSHKGSLWTSTHFVRSWFSVVESETSQSFWLSGF